MHTTEVENIKESILSDIWHKATHAPLQYRVLYLCAISLMLPFPVTCVVLPAAVVWALCQKEIRSRMFHDRKLWLLALPAVLVLVMPVVYGHWLGLAAGAGAVVVVLFYLFARTVCTDRETFDTVLDLCCLGSVCAFVYALFEPIGMWEGFRSSGGMLNPNYYGCAIEFTVLICLYKILTRAEHRRFYVIVMLLNVTGIFLCDCQSAWPAVIGGVLVALFLSEYSRHTLLYCMFALLVVVFLLTVPGMLPRLDQIPESLQLRINIWTTAVKGIQESPLLGKGLLGYMTIWEKYGGYSTYHAHNLYLDPILSIGIVGTASLMGYVVLYLVRLKRSWNVIGNRRVVALISSVLASVLIHGFSDMTILWVQTGGYLLLILGGLNCKINCEKSLDMAELECYT